MTRKEQLMAASAGRAHMGTMMDIFEWFGDWKNYFKACSMFHQYDELLQKLQKEKQNGRR